MDVNIYIYTTSKKRTRSLRRRPTGKSSITEYYEIHPRNNRNFNNLRKEIEKSLRHQSDPDENTINLTKHSFTKTEYKPLNKNLNFIPTLKVYHKNELDADLNDFFRRIKLKAYFKDTPINKNDDEGRLFKQSKNKKWTPPNNHHTINTYVEAVKKDIEQRKTLTPRKIRPNLRKDEKLALKVLLKRDDIIITNVDKGGAVVIMDVNNCTREAKPQLNDSKNYKVLTKDHTTTNNNNLINQTFVRFTKEQLINENIANGLKNPSPRTLQFYKKIHKEGNPGRPVVS